MEWGESVPSPGCTEVRGNEGSKLCSDDKGEGDTITIPTPKAAPPFCTLAWE